MVVVFGIAPRAVRRQSTVEDAVGVSEKFGCLANHDIAAAGERAMIERIVNSRTGACAILSNGATGYPTVLKCQVLEGNVSALGVGGRARVPVD
jgi:hypothetical protein